METRVVGSESCCAEMVDMASMDVELTMWRVGARDYRYRSKSSDARVTENPFTFSEWTPVFYTTHRRSLTCR